MVYPYVFINGEILPKDEARIPVWDLGLLRGLGVFDYFRVIEGIPVFMEDHVDRLFNSMEIMGLNNDVKREQWYAWIKEMVKVNQADMAGFRIVVTGGFSEDGYTIPKDKNIFLMVHSLGATVPEQYETGVSLLLKSYQRDIPYAKTTIYIESMQQQPVLKKAGAFETLYHWNGIMTECSRCNIFFIDQDGVLHTPSHEMLKGITRKQIISLAKENNMTLIERDIHIDEIQNMAGAFLTATTKGALPVVKIGSTIIGDGKVHPLAKKLQELYQIRVKSYLAENR
jgi:D-alanine transaminase/branched-chain amino acid aminotransferase